MTAQQLAFACGEYRIRMTNIGADADLSTYPSRYQLEEGGVRPSSCHVVSVLKTDAELQRRLLTAGGGASGVHEHSAVCVGDRCYAAVGDSVCALSVPQLNLLWVAKVDGATCFGVYLLPEFDCLISHGELEIARVDFAGDVVWSAGGADIFTGAFSISGRYIEAVDFNNRVYRIDIETGQER